MNKRRIVELHSDIEDHIGNADNELSDCRDSVGSADFSDLTFWLSGDLTDEDYVQHLRDQVQDECYRIESALGELECAVNQVQSAQESLELLVDALDEVIEAHNEAPDLDEGDVVTINGDETETVYEVIALVGGKHGDYAAIESDTPPYKTNLVLLSDLTEVD